MTGMLLGVIEGLRAIGPAYGPNGRLVVALVYTVLGGGLVGAVLAPAARLLLDIIVGEGHGPASQPVGHPDYSLTSLRSGSA